MGCCFLVQVYKARRKKIVKFQFKKLMISFLSLILIFTTLPVFPDNKADAAATDWDGRAPAGYKAIGSITIPQTDSGKLFKMAVNVDFTKYKYIVQSSSFSSHGLFASLVNDDVYNNHVDQDTIVGRRDSQSGGSSDLYYSNFNIDAKYNSYKGTAYLYCHSNTNTDARITIYQEIVNTAPTVSITSSGDLTVYNDKAVSIKGTVYDADNDSVTISATIGGSTKSVVVPTTSTAANWTLTWNAGEIPVGVYTNPTVFATDGVDSSAATYSGKVEIKPQIYYYWTKYTVSTKKYEILWSEFVELSSSAGTVGGVEGYRGVAPSAEGFVGVGDKVVGMGEYARDLYYITNNKQSVLMYAFNMHMSRLSMREGRIVSIDSEPQRGSLFQTNIKAVQGTYPDNGRHYDGYWYIKGTIVPNSNPVIKINTTGDQSINLKPGSDAIKLQGTVRDVDGDTVLIISTVMGVTKEVSVQNTATEKTWELTWRAVEFSDSSSETDSLVTANDGKGGVTKAYNTNKMLKVDKTPLFYWDKYDTKDVVTQYDTVYSSPSYYQIGAGEGVYGYSDFIVYTNGVIRISGYQTSVANYGTWAGSKVYIQAGDSVQRHTITDHEGVEVITISQKPNKTEKQKNKLVQSNILDLDKTYPDNGIHSDGYWYIKKSTTNMPPVLIVDHSDALIGSKDTTVKIKGTVYDADNDNIKIKASLAGIMKETTINSTSSHQDWELVWDVSDIPEDKYTNVEITADDGKKGIDVVSYIGTVTVDKTPPVITIAPGESTWVKEPIKASVTYVDGLSGIRSTTRQYKVTSNQDTPETWDVSDSDQLNLMIEDDGQWYIHTKVQDLAGNVTTTVTGPYQLQHVPSSPMLKVNGVTSESIKLGWTLPTITYTDGYQYTVKNLTTGKTWTVTYPTDHIIEEDVKPGMVYEYVVKVKNHVGEVASEPFKVLTLPTQVEGLKIGFKDYHSDQATITFSAVPSATGYQFKLYKALNDGHEQVNEQNWKEAGQHDICKLEAGKQYYATVSAVNASGQGEATSIGFISLPAAPGEFNIVQVTDQSATLGWLPSETASSYQLMRSEQEVYKGKDLNYTDSGLESATSYNYQLAAKNESGFGDITDLDVLTLPSKVLPKVEKVTASTVDLSWDVVNGADKYVVTVDGKAILEVDPAKSKAQVTDLETGTGYDIAVVAQNASGQSTPNVMHVKTLSVAPINIQVKEVGETSVVMNWDASVGADKYKVKLKDQEYEAAETELKLDGLVRDQEYDVTIQAGNESGYGEEAKFTFLTLPSAPEVKVDKLQSDVISMIWDKQQNAKSYKIYDGNEKEFAEIEEPTYKVSKLEAGKTYTIYVSVVNKSGEGAKTKIVQQTLPGGWGNAEAELSQIVKVSDITLNSVTLSWKAALGADQYKIVDAQNTILGQVKAPTTNLRIPELVSSTSYKGWKLVPLNDAGEGLAAPVPSFNTLAPYFEGKEKSISDELNHEIPSNKLPKEKEEGMHKQVVDLEQQQNKKKPYFEDINTSFAQSEILGLAEKGIVKGVSETEFAPDQKVTRVEFASMMVRALELQEASNVPLTFEDIQKSAWYVPELSAAILSGVAHGFSDKEFRPQDPITREQASKMIANSMYNGLIPSGEINFKDVNSIAVWAKPEVTALTTEKVITGYPDGNFKPKRDLTRAECAVLIYRSLGLLK